MAPLGEARGRPSAATKTQDSQIKINTFLKKPFGTFTNDWCEVFQQVKNVKVLAAQSWTITRQAPLSMEFSRQEYWVGSHSLLQGIFPTQELNLDLVHHRQILHHLSYLQQAFPGKFLQKLLKKIFFNHLKALESG